MKKSALVLIAVVVVIGGAVAVILSNGNKTKTNTSDTTTSTDSGNITYTPVDACSILTSSIAAQILGSSAAKGAPPADTETTSDIAFSQCIYTGGPAADPPHVISVSVRSAKDATGVVSNKSVFSSPGKPSGVQDVTGYGNSAYWDPDMGQLDILKGNNWYIISNYTGT